ncbi:MAG: sugar phosphorylase [Desulfosarcina sp.]|jgi:sucrose phosphorylase
MRSILRRIYGTTKGNQAFDRIFAAMAKARPIAKTGNRSLFSQSDIILIAYGDTLVSGTESPLKTLGHFLNDHLKGVFNGVHILPFFPYSSDDGFSVTDFRAVRSDLGSWADIRTISKDFKPMIDLVANHVSAKSRWFQSYLNGAAGFSDLAIEVDPDVDLSLVTRPRALPLLTAFTKRSGRRVHVWTTFSADQIDINYHSLDVLEHMVRILLFYIRQGAQLIRLDAIAYLWKQIGTPCIHLPQTHDMVRLFRKILDLTAPGVILVTETNVPHDENVSYFGDGADEAQMVYNFTLPPLLLYSLVTGNARVFSKWAQTLVLPSSQTAFLNFTASHDGIGVRPLEGWLPPSEISLLIDRVRQNGGRVSMRQNPDGSPTPYELNITYLDALKDPASPDDPFHISRFLASQAVALTLPGVPAVYIHSLLGSTNWLEGVALTGRARTINRERLRADTVFADLADRRGHRWTVFYPYLDMIRIRNRQPAFHPTAEMQVLDLDDRVFAAKRYCVQQSLISLTNFTSSMLTVKLSAHAGPSYSLDLLSSARIAMDKIPLSAYQTRWLVVERDTTNGNDG